MGVPMRGRAARNQQAKSMARVSKAKTDAAKATKRARHSIFFDLMVNRKGVCSLRYNKHTLMQMQHQIKEFSNAEVQYIKVRMDGGESAIELVTDVPVENFVVDRLRVLGSQLK